MVMTPSTMLPLGTPAPGFSLVNIDGQKVSLVDYSDAKGLLVIFMCNHCPFVIHLAEALAQFGQEYQEKGLGIVAINSNDITTHPDDAPDKMVAEARQRGYSFAYLYDPTQKVAKAYRAACTPDFFLFDGEKKLVYRGQFDASRPDSGLPITGKDLRRAADAVLAGQTPSSDQTPSVGCNIKWTPGNEPDYFS